MVESGIGRAANAALAALPGFTLPGDISASSRFYQRDIVTMRVFDVLASGGFVLAEWSEDLAELRPAQGEARVVGAAVRRRWPMARMVIRHAQQGPRRGT